MPEFESNRELIQAIFEGLREILKMTLLIRELILDEEFEGLPELLFRREEKINEVGELLKEFENSKGRILNFDQVKGEIAELSEQILKIDRENADNIKEKMKQISEELMELIERKKLLRYLR
jgi:seryl-tRNA synthetase